MYCQKKTQQKNNFNYSRNRTAFVVVVVCLLVWIFGGISFSYLVSENCPTQNIQLVTVKNTWSLKQHFIFCKTQNIKSLSDESVSVLLIQCVKMGLSKCWLTDRDDLNLEQLGSLKHDGHDHRSCHLMSELTSSCLLLLSGPEHKVFCPYSLWFRCLLLVIFLVAAGRKPFLVSTMCDIFLCSDNICPHSFSNRTYYSYMMFWTLTCVGAPHVRDSVPFCMCALVTWPKTRLSATAIWSGWQITCRTTPLRQAAPAAPALDGSPTSASDKSKARSSAVQV